MANGIIKSNLSNGLSVLNEVSDLNNAKLSGNSGISVFSYASTASNNPGITGGRVLVIGLNTSQYFSQIAFPNGSSSTSAYIRNGYNNGFTEWKSLV